MTDKTYIPITSVELFAARVLREALNIGGGYNSQILRMAISCDLWDGMTKTEGQTLLDRLVEHDRREEIVKLRARLAELESCEPKKEKR